MSGVCPGCKKKITGQSITALKKDWHPEHFVCSRCTNTLVGKEEFFVRLQHDIEAATARLVGEAAAELSARGIRGDSLIRSA